jgi:hypothetical protein
MKIYEISTLNLNESFFKLSDKSITVKDSNNKTKAVINHIQSVKSLPFNRKVELNIKYKGKLNEFMDHLYIAQDNTLYYFIDNNHHKFLCESANNGFPDEMNKLLAKIKTLTENNVNVLFVNIV